MPKYDITVYEFEKNGIVYACDNFIIRDDGVLILQVEISKGDRYSAEILAVYASGKWVRFVNNTAKRSTENG